MGAATAEACAEDRRRGVVAGVRPGILQAPHRAAGETAEVGAAARVKPTAEGLLAEVARDSAAAGAGAADSWQGAAGGEAAGAGGFGLRAGTATRVPAPAAAFSTHKMRWRRQALAPRLLAAGAGAGAVGEEGAAQQMRPAGGRRHRPWSLLSNPSLTSVFHRATSFQKLKCA